MRRQPIIEMTDNLRNISDCRFVILVCPHAQTCRVEVRKLRSGRSSSTNVSKLANSEALISILRRRGIFRVIFKLAFNFTKTQSVNIHWHTAEAFEKAFEKALNDKPI